MWWFNVEESLLLILYWLPLSGRMEEEKIVMATGFVPCMFLNFAVWLPTHRMKKQKKPPDIYHNNPSLLSSAINHRCFREQSDFPQQVIHEIYKMKAIAGKWSVCSTETIFFCPFPVVPTSQYKGTLSAYVMLVSENVKLRIPHTLTTKTTTERN